MPKVWSDRIDSVLADEKAKRIAAALYYLIDSSINSPITRKRRTPEDLLMEEATSIVEMSDKELLREQVQNEERAWEERAWQDWEKRRG